MPTLSPCVSAALRSGKACPASEPAPCREATMRAAQSLRPELAPISEAEPCPPQPGVAKPPWRGVIHLSAASGSSSRKRLLRL